MTKEKAMPPKESTLGIGPIIHEEKAMTTRDATGRPSMLSKDMEFHAAFSAELSDAWKNHIINDWVPKVAALEASDSPTALKRLREYLHMRRAHARKYLKTHPDDIRVRGQMQGYETIRVKLRKMMKQAEGGAEE